MKKLLAILLTLTLVLGLMAGCGSSAASSTEAASSAPAEASAEAPAEEAAEAPAEAAPAEEAAEAPAASAAEEASAEEAASAEEEAPVEYDSMADMYFAKSMETNEWYKELQEDNNPISYPIADGAELSMWRVFSAFIWNGLMDSYADMPTLPLIEEATGVKVTFTEVSDSSSSEQFNLIIASGDYPDLMSMDNYSGTVTAAYDDDVVIDMTPYAEKDLPNYLTLVDTLDDYTLKSIYTDDGKMLRVWTIASNVVEEQGLSYRADWARDLGFDSITTTDDMYEYLKAANSAHPMTYPIFIDNSAVLGGLTGAFGMPGITIGQTSLGMFIRDGQICTAVTDDGLRRYAEYFHKLYSEGLIKDDFYSESYGPDYINSYVQEDQCAVTAIRSDKFPTMTENAIDPNFDFEALAALVENEGDTYKFNNKSAMLGNGNMSVTTCCEDPEMALQFLNWFYTWDAYMTTNYGEEGVAFEYDADGNPVYTDFIVNNPDGYNSMNLRNMYTNPVFCNYINATAVFYTYGEVQLGAFDVWNNTGSDECTLPTMTLTADENEEYANIASTVFTYATEHILAWMVGEEELNDDTWNEYISNCEDMDIDRCVEIYQDVYNRMYG